MSQSQYFRAGAGTVIYNDTGQILLFLRAGTPALWQLQQGGMDHGETMKETLWRELEEETGLTADDIDTVKAYPGWLLYEYPAEISKGICLGQIHRWFYLKLKPNTTIDLTKVEDKEFTDYSWSNFSQLLDDKDGFKYPVYQTLADYFKKHIL